MKKLLGVALAGAFSLAASQAHAAGELYFYNWTDYTAPDLITKFEKETGIKVTVDTYDSNETLLAKLKSGATGYDLAVPSQNFVTIMVAENLLEEVDVSKMENFKHVAKAFRFPEWDPKQMFSSPYQMGTTSYALRTDAGVGDCSSLKEFFEPNEKASGSVGVFKTPEEVANMGHIYLGQEFCTEKTEDLKALQALLQKQKEHVKVFSSEGTMDRLGSGVTTISNAWNGDAMKQRLAGQKVKYCFPKEGVVGWYDSLVIPKGAKNVENAKTFMNWLMKPENMAIQSDFAKYANPIEGSGKHMSKDMATSPEVSVPTVPVKFGRSCGPKYVKAIDKIWTKLLQ
ncbi:MAG: extracellular solute-binding protein [Alphaproteobacteria bacterium]|nr:extracellular solute-binding protein [Alphaproteobacteria bacterium]